MIHSVGKYLSLAAISAMANAQTDAVRAKYPIMDRLMADWNFSWEVHTVTTDDGWLLDMFRITGIDN